MKIKNFLSTVYAYDNSSGWKLDDDGNVVMKDGNPVYVDNSGREMTVKNDTISNLNAEAKSHREAKEAAEKALKSFEGLDADKAREAIAKLQDVDAKKLIDAGKVDEVKAQITEQFKSQLKEKEDLAAQLQSKLDTMQIESVFKSSQFVRDNVAVPQDMFEATFRNNFKVEDGRVVAYDKSGNRINSTENVGEYATPEEALRLLVETHPNKDSILKADIGKGSGSDGAGGNRPGGRVIRRSDFANLAPGKQAEIAQKAASGEMKIVD